MFKWSNALLSFKKSIGVVLVFLLGFGYNLGASFDIQGHRYKWNSNVVYCFYDSTKKVQQSEYIGNKSTYDIKLARNEYEACQIAIRSKFNSAHVNYKIEFTEFKNDNGDVLESAVYQENYIGCDSNKHYGRFPDALIPYTQPKELPLGYARNFMFYIQVHANKNTPAGKYKAQVKVTNTTKDNKVELIADVTATVWDFTLPETPSSESAFGLGRGNIARLHGTANNPAKTQELYEKYYEYLLSRKISPYHLPVDILSNEADAYMSDPRVTSFIVPYHADDAMIIKYRDKIKSNPEWEKKAYFYPIDEPTSLEHYATYSTITDRLARLWPGYNMVTPANTVGFEENGKRYYTTELQAGKSNIMCGISEIFDSKEFLNGVEKLREIDTKIWWYVCCGPQGDYCNVFTHWDGIKARLLLWQQKSLNIEGLLYWDTTFWSDVISPWASSWTTPWTGFYAFGDGSLFYNGNPIGVDGPVSSLRLEQISDGIDDFEYLTIAEKLFGRKYVDEMIAKVSNTLTDYTLNDELLASVRVELGNAIEAELRK